MRIIIIVGLALLAIAYGEAGRYYRNFKGNMASSSYPYTDVDHSAMGHAQRRSAPYRRDVDHAAMGHISRRSARPIDTYDNKYVRSRRDVDHAAMSHVQRRSTPYTDVNHASMGHISRRSARPIDTYDNAYVRSRRDVGHIGMDHVQRRNVLFKRSSVVKRSYEIFPQKQTRSAVTKKRSTDEAPAKETNKSKPDEDVKLDAKSLGYPMYGGYYGYPMYGYGRYGGYPMYGRYGYGDYPMYGGYGYGR